MRRFAYLHVDVFTDKPFGGNPLSVFLDAQGLSADEMQAIAREMNHSETTFLFPPAKRGAAKVRIFTPAMEIPFAGHPVVGTGFAVAHERNLPRGESVTLELQHVEIATRVEALSPGASPPDSHPAASGGAAAFVWMTQPPPERGMRVTDVDRIARALGVGRGDLLVDDGGAEVWSTGLPFLFVPVTGQTPMGRMRPNPQVLPELLHDAQARGVYVITRDVADRAAAVRGRCFPIGVGVVEDAATGSAAGALAGYLLQHAWTKPGRIKIEQGLELGRPSSIHLDVAAAGQPVRVGGSVVAVGRGEIAIH